MARFAKQELKIGRWSIQRRNPLPTSSAFIGHGEINARICPTNDPCGQDARGHYVQDAGTQRHRLQTTHRLHPQQLLKPLSPRLSTPHGCHGRLELRRHRRHKLRRTLGLQLSPYPPPRLHSRNATGVIQERRVDRCRSTARNSCREYQVNA